MKFRGVEMNSNKPRAVFEMSFKEVQIVSEIAGIAYRNAPNLPETLPHKTRVFNLREVLRKAIYQFPPEGNYKEDDESQ